MSFTLSTGEESMHLRICRCCVEKDYYRVISTDSYNLGKKESYENMLKDVFNIQFLHDYEDRFICEKCFLRLCDASTFKQMVIKNQEYFQNQLYKDINLSNPEFKVAEVKQEVSLDDFDMKTFDDHDDSFDDNEILANLKDEAHRDTDKPDKQKSPLKKTNLKRCKQKAKNSENDELKKSEQPKSTDHRGTGPVLRENSLKLLAHSTAVIFQWNKSRYRCFCCKEPFSDIDLLRAHNEQHTLQDIQKKIINQQNRPVKVEVSSLNCKLCQKQLNDLENLKDHLIEHNIEVGSHLLVPFKIESKLKCQICSEPFTLFRLLNIHMNKHYQNHVCYICGVGFSNLVFLNLHRSRSHRPINCIKCNISFVSRAEKKQHDTQIHGTKYERKNRFPCPFCQDRFFQESLRVKHMVVEHGMKKPDFSCQFCLKSFITKSLVNNHVKVVHMKEKNHECDVCHNLFYSKSDLTRHKVTHTGEKNYACSICSNPFASKDSLRRHMKRTHVLH